eukprot:EG_transcript_13490
MTTHTDELDSFEPPCDDAVSSASAFPTAEPQEPEAPDAAQLCFNHLLSKCTNARCPRQHVADPAATRCLLAERRCPDDGKCRLRQCPYHHVHPPEAVPRPTQRPVLSTFVPSPLSSPPESPLDLPTFSFRPIGFARTCYREKHGAPRQTGLVPSAWAVVELCRGSRFSQAVDGLEQFSHLWLVYVFDRAHDRGADWHPYIETPRETQGARVGVFACRAPDRPNPIGISAVELERVVRVRGEPVRIYVKGMDLLDRTPILDIKPYIPYADRIDQATTGWIRDEVPCWPVRFEAGVTLPADLDPLLVHTLRIDPRPVPQKKRWPVGAEESERQKFAFRLGQWDVKWVIRGQEFWVTAIEEATAAQTSPTESTDGDADDAPSLHRP